MTGRLDGQHILLTGGGSGIGRAAALAYAEHGARVTVLERSAENARSLVQEAGEAVAVRVGDALDTETLAKAVKSAAGPHGLDNLTCCVGVFDYYASLRSISAQELASAAEEIYRVNVLGALIAIHASLPALQSPNGSVTLTLSESAFSPVGGGVLYASSKWALRGAVSHLAKDLAPEVRVNGVAPGGTTGTKFGGLDALGQTQTADEVTGREERIASGSLLGVAPRPEDHAGAYVFLADRAAARVLTGVIINSDGGRR